MRSNIHDSEAGRVQAHIEALSAGDSQSNVRKLAAKMLGTIGDPAAVPALVGALRDSDGDVREWAAWALGEIGDARAVHALIGALKDTTVLVRKTAEDALRRIGDAQTLPLRVLACAALTPPGKLDALVAMQRQLRYVPIAIPAYCQSVLERTDLEDEVRAGAEGVLSEIRNRTDAQSLGRAAARNISAEGAELLRAGTSVPPGDADELLLPAQPAPGDKDQSAPAPGRPRVRWFSRK